MDELVERFELWNVQKAWAFFDVERLEFFNANYLKSLDFDTVYSRFETYLEKYDSEFLVKIKEFPEEYNRKILKELTTKIKKFADYKEQTAFFYNNWNYKIDEELFVNPKMKIEDLDTAKKALEVSKGILESIDTVESIDQIKPIFIEKIKEAEMKNGQVLWPLRVVLTWEKFSPWALEMVYILGKEESINRLNKYLNA